MRSFSILISIMLFYSAQCLGQLVEVHGRITNFPTDAKATMAMAGINNFLTGQDRVRTEIQPDGAFELTFELEHPQDIFFRIAGVSFDLIMEPGETLEINWEYTEDQGEKPPSFLQFSGIHAQRHRHFSTILARQFAGKVIYIDLWATWCGPCIAEMNYYPKLIEHYRDQEVVFVFLAAHSPENLWKKRINEFGLEGQHYRLNEKQYYALEEYFELRGFPQHVIVNRKREVVEAKGPRVHDVEGNLNVDLLRLLDGLLGE